MIFKLFQIIAKQFILFVFCFCFLFFIFQTSSCAKAASWGAGWKWGGHRVYDSFLQACGTSKARSEVASGDNPEFTVGSRQSYLGIQLTPTHLLGLLPAHSITQPEMKQKDVCNL